jgi:hypothetical protein
MKKKITISALIFSCLIFFSCSKIDGFFSFKKFQDTSFKKYSIHKEFSQNESVRWMFTASKVSTPVSIGVLLMKKELIWVTVSSRKDLLHLKKQRVYGDIKDLEPGSYKILITDIKNKNSVVGQCNFKIYNNN